MPCGALPDFVSILVLSGHLVPTQNMCLGIAGFIADTIVYLLICLSLFEFDNEDRIRTFYIVEKTSALLDTQF